MSGGGGRVKVPPPPSPEPTPLVGEELDETKRKVSKRAKRGRASTILAGKMMDERDNIYRTILG